MPHAQNANRTRAEQPIPYRLAPETGHAKNGMKWPIWMHGQSSCVARAYAGTKKYRNIRWGFDTCLWIKMRGRHHDTIGWRLCFSERTGRHMPDIAIALPLAKYINTL